ncbi:unnamed protein product [Prorocentrum cordatum]|uniref:Uncharacterized protein n=1 Tax=Prorocentrum cordatum TaxID=2364126 RepID=A0ABN9TUE7_9DINO|nr:unnamed protein product [Polarella glacialis]
MLRDIVSKFPDGAHPLESKDLDRQIKQYVERMWEELHKDASSAAILMDGFQQDEKDLMEAMRAHSEVLSREHFLSDRLEREEARTESALELLEKYERKLDAVCGRDTMATVLSCTLEKFFEEHTESQRLRREEQEKHVSLARAAADRRSQLDSHLAAEEVQFSATNDAAKKSAVATETALTEAIDLIQQGFQQIRDSIAADLAVRSELARAKSRIEAARAKVAEYSPTLARSEDIHGRIAAQCGEAFDLQLAFAEWLRTAYQGMNRKTQLTMDELRSNLPDDSEFRQVSAGRPCHRGGTQAAVWTAPVSPDDHRAAHTAARG